MNKKYYRDEKGNLKYKCWNCGKEFNFKTMKYIEENKQYCPNCNKPIKL